MNNKLIVIFSVFSLFITILVLYSENIFYYGPYLFTNESIKQKILEFEDTSVAISFVKNHSIENINKIIEIWDYKKGIDQSINTKKLTQEINKFIEKTFKLTIYTSKNDTIKIKVHYETKRQKAESEYYFKDKKLVLLNLRWVDSPNTKMNQQESSFIDNDTLLYITRKPSYCVLIDDENYVTSEVKRIKQSLKMLLSKSK